MVQVIRVESQFMITIDIVCFDKIIHVCHSFIYAHVCTFSCPLHIVSFMVTTLSSVSDQYNYCILWLHCIKTVDADGG